MYPHHGNRTLQLSHVWSKLVLLLCPHPLELLLCLIVYLLSAIIQLLMFASYSLHFATLYSFLCVTGQKIVKKTVLCFVWKYELCYSELLEYVFNSHQSYCCFFFFTVQQNSACYPSEHVGPSMKPSSMHHHISSGLSNAFTNGGSSLQTSMHTAVDMSANTCRIDAPQDMLSTRSPNLGLMQGMNGGMIKPEAGYSGSSPFMFGADNTALEKRVAIGDASVTPFSSVVSNSQTLGEPLLDSDTSTYGFLGQIPQSFSLSDLTAGFSQSSGLSSCSFVSCPCCSFPLLNIDALKPFDFIKDPSQFPHESIRTCWG